MSTKVYSFINQLIICIYKYYCILYFIGYIKSLLEVKFTRNAKTDEKMKEEAAFIYFMDFLDECEGLYFSIYMSFLSYQVLCNFVLRVSF